MGQSLYKNWLLISKITWGIWTTSDKQWKVQKVEIWWATFVQKNHFPKICIPSAKTLYTYDLSNITFNYLCEYSPKFTYVIFEIVSHFSQQNSSISFLDQALHAFYKSCQSKCKFLDFPLMELKFTKFLMSIFKQKVRFSSKFESFFSVMRDNSSVLF